MRQRMTRSCRRDPDGVRIGNAEQRVDLGSRHSRFGARSQGGPRGSRLLGCASDHLPVRRARAVPCKWRVTHGWARLSEPRTTRHVPVGESWRTRSRQSSPMDGDACLARARPPPARATVPLRRASASRDGAPVAAGRRSPALPPETPLARWRDARRLHAAGTRREARRARPAAALPSRPLPRRARPVRERARSHCASGAGRIDDSIRFESRFRCHTEMR